MDISSDKLERSCSKKTLTRLRKRNLNRETKSLLIAAQNNAKKNYVTAKKKKKKKRKEKWKKRKRNEIADIDYVGTAMNYQSHNKRMHEGV